MSALTRWVFFIALFVVFLLPPTDPDLGWQLRCGELFWQERSFCEHNQFSVLLENYSWPNHAWGYQATIYPIFKFFGLHGLTVFNALLMTAAFGFLFAAIYPSKPRLANRQAWRSGVEKMLGILATIYFGWGVFSFGIRSQLVGFLLFNLTLFLLTKTEEKPRLSFLLPLVMLIWANSHGSVILGLILLFLSYFMATAYKRERILLHTVVTAVSGLATLINPFGFRIYEEMWQHFSGPIDLSKLIAEWVPPNPQIQQIILISGGAAFLFILFKSPIKSLLILLFAFWALHARRNVPFYFIVLSYSLLNSLKTKTSPLRNQLATLLSAGVLLYGLIVQLPQAGAQDLCRGDIPCDAIEFLKAQKEKGNIFNRYEWGGFLIWQLPEYKIFVDGRMPAWPASAPPSEARGDGPTTTSPYTIYLHTLQTRPGWQETLDTYDIAYILISPNTFMDLLLAPDPAKFGWQEVFRNKISVVYKKS